MGGVILREGLKTRAYIRFVRLALVKGQRAIAKGRVADSALRCEEGLEYGDELPGVEGLGEEVPAQGAESFGGLLAVQGGYDNPDGSVGWLLVRGAEQLQDRSTLAVGKLEVEDRGVRGTLLEDA